MPQYVKTVWVNGTVPALNDSNLNKMEQGIFDAFRQDGSTTMSGQLVTTAGSASTPAIAPTGDANTGIFFPAADTIAFGEGGTEAMRINSSGQVGIGTTTPTALTSMHGSPQATSGAILTLRDTTATGANTTYGAISFLSSPGTDFSIGKASENANSALAFRNANTGAEFMRITSSGNVGIGTTSPGDKLHVVGNIYLGTASQTIYTAGTGNLTLQTGTGNIIFARNNAADTTMFLNNSGNVGIGTNSPTSELHVYANGGVADLMVETNTTGGDSKIALKCNGAGGRHWYWQTGDNTSTLNGRLRLWDSTAGVERFTITSTGNVGIGTSSIPSVFGTTVKVAGSTGATIETSATNVNLRQFVSDSLAVGAIGTSTNHPFYFLTNDAERMRITSAGNVGIGTTSPSKKFTVYSSNNIYDECIQVVNTGSSGGSVAGIKFYTENSTAALTGFTVGKLPSGDGHICTIWNENNSAIQIGTNNLERIRITSGGNVGIGTTEPQSLLHVGSGHGVKLSAGTSLWSNKKVIETGYSTEDWTDILVASSGSNTARLRLTYTGYALIGYTSSNGSYPLQVNGQIFATSSTIATSDGRYKKDVVALDGALDIVKALNPVQFSWKEHPVHKFNTDVPTIGFIAQEVEQALADKSYLTSIIKKSECTWETETGEFVDREVTRDVEKQVTREVEREITETIDGEEVTRTVTEEITETIIEQVTEIVTEPVKETHTEEFLGIAESNLIAILTKAVKELAAEVEALKAQLNGN